MHTIALVCHQAVLFSHLIAFAFALVTVVSEDWRLLTVEKVATERLDKVAHRISILLLVLWLTGLGLIAAHSGFDWASLVNKPKLAVKLTVVSVLTLNGLLLTFLVLPMFAHPPSKPRLAAAVAAAVGAISLVSWVFAAFVGAARVVAPVLGYQGLVWIYLAALSLGLVTSQLYARPRIERIMAQHHRVTAAGRATRPRHFLAQPGL